MKSCSQRDLTKLTVGEKGAMLAPTATPTLAPMPLSRDALISRGRAVVERRKKERQENQREIAKRVAERKKEDAERKKREDQVNY